MHSVAALAGGGGGGGGGVGWSADFVERMRAVLEADGECGGGGGGGGLHPLPRPALRGALTVAAGLEEAQPEKERS